MRVRTNALVGLVILSAMLGDFSLVPGSSMAKGIGSSVGIVLDTIHIGRCGNFISPMSSFGGYTDVDENDPFCAPIEYEGSIGAALGYSDYTFRPYNSVTRGEFSKMLMLTLGTTLQNPPTPHFADVPAGSTFYQYIETAYSKGFLSGKYGVAGHINSCTHVVEYPSLAYFHPCDNITRGEIAKIVSQAGGLTEDILGRNTYSDVPSSHTFYTYTERLANRIATDELMPFYTTQNPGRPDCGSPGYQPCFFPDYATTRADAAQALYFIMSYKDLTTYDPITGLTSYQAGRSFSRRFSSASDILAPRYNSIRSYISTPIQDPPIGSYVAAPFALADVTNGIFFEVGPDRVCSASIGCYNQVYSSAYCNGRSKGLYSQFVTFSGMASGQSYRYQLYYASGSNQWWSEYYDTNTNQWTRVGTLGDFGATSFREATMAAETGKYTESSGQITFTDVEAQLVGGTLLNICWDPGIFQRRLFHATISSCSVSGPTPYSWNVEYNP